MDAFNKILNLGEYRGKGDADSALMLFTDDLQRMYPDARWVIVERDVVEVMVSLKNSFINAFNNEEIQRRMHILAGGLDYIKQNLSPLVVQFDNIFDAPTAKIVWEHCLPGVKFDARRFNLLQDFNVSIVEDDLRILSRKYSDSIIFKRGGKNACA